MLLLLMTLLTTVLTCVLGVFFMLMAFFTTGIRGAFSRGPTLPITRAGRIILFLIGLVVFISGMKQLIH